MWTAITIKDDYGDGGIKGCSVFVAGTINHAQISTCEPSFFLDFIFIPRMDVTVIFCCRLFDGPNDGPDDLFYRLLTFHT